MRFGGNFGGKCKKCPLLAAKPPRKWGRANGYKTKTISKQSGYRGRRRRGSAPMTPPCKRRIRARAGRDLSAVMHEFMRCIVFIYLIRLAVRHKNGCPCGGLPHCRFSAVKQIFHFGKKCTTTAYNGHFVRQTKQSCTKKQARKWHFCLLPAFWGTAIIEGKKYLFIS